jgi:hypothetical protein
MAALCDDREEHSLGELREARRWVYASCKDAAFVRGYHFGKTPEFRWVDTWKKELLPIERFGFHLGLEDSTTYSLQPKGSPDDASVFVAGGLLPLQITLAFEEFDASGEQGEGYHHRLQAEFLIEHGRGMGGDRYRRTNGKVERVSRRGATWAGEIEENWSDAIGRALRRKAHAVNGNCHLLVFCTDFSLLGASHFEKIAAEQTAQLATLFQSVAIIGHHEGYRYWHNAPCAWPSRPLDR